jgi:hypothetical protein
MTNSLNCDRRLFGTHAARQVANASKTGKQDSKQAQNKCASTIINNNCFRCSQL